MEMVQMHPQLSLVLCKKNSHMVKEGRVGVGVGVKVGVKVEMKRQWVG